MTVKFSLPLSAASHIRRTLNAIYKWINGRNFPYRILFALIIIAAATARTATVHKLIPTINANTFKAAD